MFKLLNRFAWLVSLLFWFVILFFFWLLFDEMDWNYWFLDSDYFLVWLFFSTMIWMLFKKIFLSKAFVEKRITFFANALWSPSIEPVNDIDKLKYEEELESEVKNDNIAEVNQSFDEDIEETTEKVSNIPVKVKKEEVEEEIDSEPTQFEILFSKLLSFIKDFFSTNILAKIWWILVFLAVVFFLQQVAWYMWDSIWAIWRIIVSFIVWFVIYWVWVTLHKKGSENEWLILMWIWILINYAVILLWRYIIWDAWHDWYLSETTTFLFLILNTIFWIVTSLVYESRTLLVFSIVFAYFNPFIIWAESNWHPYTLVWYSFIVSLWALYLSNKNKDLSLLLISFILWNLLFLFAPFSDSIWWITKISMSAILSSLVIYNSTNLQKDYKNILTKIFLWTYLFIILNLINSTGQLGDTISFIVYNVIILWLFWLSIYLISNKSKKGSVFNYIFFVPLIILWIILLSWNLLSVPFVLIFTVLIYLFSFTYLNQKFTNAFTYIFFTFILIFIFLFDLNLWYDYLNSVNGYDLWSWEIDIARFVTILATSFIFLFTSYYHSLRNWLSNLFSIWTIWSVLILAPIVSLPWNYIQNNNETVFLLSISAIVLFWLANFILPLINKNLTEKAENISSLIIWSLVWVLFLAFQIFNYWERYFPWIAEWFAFLWLAITYVLLAFAIFSKGEKSDSIDSESLKNVFYTYTWIGISLFSLAVAFVFSNYPEIITTTWLFEATILFYFYSKTNKAIIYTAWNVLFVIWVIKFWILLDVVNRWDYMFLVSFSIIFASLILNLKFIDFKNVLKDKANWNLFHYLFHIVSMWIMWLLLLEIIPSTWQWWSMLWISVFLIITWVFYALFNSKFLKIFFIIVLSLFLLLHISWVDWIFNTLVYKDKTYLKILQYIVSAIVVLNIFTWKKFNKEVFLNNVLSIIIWIYVFIISSIYVYDIFESLLQHYSLTIYWGLIASSLLIYWIQKDIIKYRTIWLYFLTLTTLKIFFVDVGWIEADTNSKVFVFFILWVILIFISTIYTKRYWDNLLGEFRISNLFKQKKINSVQDDDIFKDTTEEDLLINKEIKNINIDDYKSVTFIINNERKAEIRAKNLVKISKMLIDKFWKNKYKAWELQDAYDFILSNYKTKLSKRDYDKIVSILKDFVKLWWEVILNKKV